MNRCLRLLALSICSLLSFSIARAEPAPADPLPAKETVFEGFVLDPMGEPVTEAIVTVPARGIRATTDADGRVQLRLPPGVHVVRVESPGFLTAEERLPFDDATALSGFEVLLEYDAGEVVVTGAQEKQQAETAPVKTQVVAREQIERRKAANLAEALDATSGVRVETTCQNCGMTQVRLNGLEGRYTQMLIDGHPVFSTLAGVYGLEQIPQEMIERVEVIKGGGSALYGGAAVAGVINVVTRRPERSFGNTAVRWELLGEQSAQYRIAANAGLVNDEGTLALHLFGGGSSREPWDANGDGFSEIGKAQQVAAGSELYWDVFPGGELQLKLHLLREYRRGGNAFDQVEHDAAIAEMARTWRTGGEIRFRHLANEHVRYELGYGFAYTDRHSYYGAGGDVLVPELPADPGDLDPAQYQDFLDAWAMKQAALNAYGHTVNPVHTADTIGHFSFDALGTMIVTTGVQFMSDGLEDTAPAYDRTIQQTYWDIAGVVQHEWLFADWGESVVGLRVDNHSELDEAVLSPRGALLFNPLEWLRLRTSVALGFRPPQVFDEDLHITIVGGEGQIIRNDPDLGPERSVSLAQQLVLHSDPEDWHLEFGLNGFYTRIADAFVLAETDDVATTNQVEFTRINRGLTQVGGGEAEVSARYQQIWGVGVGWTYEYAANDTPDPDFGATELLRTPQTYGYVETWTMPVRGLQLQTSIQITGPMKVPHYAGFIAQNRLEQSPWFCDWGAHVSQQVDAGHGVYLQPFIGVRNILNAFQDDFDRGRRRDAGYIYGPRSPRTFLAGLKLGI